MSVYYPSKSEVEKDELSEYALALLRGKPSMRDLTVERVRKYFDLKCLPKVIVGMGARFADYTTQEKLALDHIISKGGILFVPDPQAMPLVAVDAELIPPPASTRPTSPRPDPPPITEAEASDIRGLVGQKDPDTGEPFTPNGIANLLALTVEQVNEVLAKNPPPVQSPPPSPVAPPPAPPILPNRTPPTPPSPIPPPNPDEGDWNDAGETTDANETDVTIVESPSIGTVPGVVSEPAPEPVPVDVVPEERAADDNPYEAWFEDKAPVPVSGPYAANLQVAHTTPTTTPVSSPPRSMQESPVRDATLGSPQEEMGRLLELAESLGRQVRQYRDDAVLEATNNARVEGERDAYRQSLWAREGESLERARNPPVPPTPAPAPKVEVFVVNPTPTTAPVRPQSPPSSPPPRLPVQPPPPRPHPMFSRPARTLVAFLMFATVALMMLGALDAVLQFDPPFSARGIAGPGAFVVLSVVPCLAIVAVALLSFLVRE